MSKKSLYILGLGAFLLAAGCMLQSAASRNRGDSQNPGASLSPSNSQAADASQNQSSTRQTFAMDTVMSFTAYGADSEAAVDAAAAEVLRLDALLSAASDTSEVSRLNENGGGTVSGETADLLRLSLQTWEETGGLFDCTIYPLVELWGFPTHEYRVPGPDGLAASLALVDSSKLSLDGETLTLGEGQKIDFGGVGKGYAAARIMDIFKAHGITSGMVSLGGNVQVLGSKPDQSPWRIGVQDPNGEGYVGILLLTDQAAVTSGGYERYFEADGQTYIHILDPRTGCPAESDLLSVTVVTEDGARADALSTSLFLMGKEEAVSFWRADRGFDMVLISEDGEISVTEGLRDAFTSEKPFTVVEQRLQ